MRTTRTETPVLVLQAPAHGALGLVRSLGRLGVPVFTVEANPRAVALVSRYCRGSFLWDMEAASPQQTVDFLLTIGRKIGRRTLLIPTSTEDAALFVAEHADALSECYDFPRITPELVKALASKREMFFLAKKLGIPTAETVFPTCREDVLHFAETATFPVMLKAEDGMRLLRRAGVKMVIASDRATLLERYDALEDPEQPNLMLQEYIPGGEDTIWMFNGYFNQNSDCLVGYTGNKIRQTPVYTGATSLGLCIQNETVDRLTREFMKSVGYRGILDIGYRFDARDGQYKVLDVNPRLGGTFRLFLSQNGIDVARALYLDMTGQSVPQSPVRWGRKWIVENADPVSSYRYYRDGKLKFAPWLRSFAGVQECAFFAWDDLRPFFRMCANAWTEYKRKRAIRATNRAAQLATPASQAENTAHLPHTAPVAVVSKGSLDA